MLVRSKRMGNGCSSNQRFDNTSNKIQHNSQDNKLQSKTYQINVIPTTINKINNHLIDGVPKDVSNENIEFKNKYSSRSIVRNELIQMKFMNSILSHMKTNDIQTLLQVFRYLSSHEREKSMLCLSPNQHSLKNTRDSFQDSLNTSSSTTNTMQLHSNQNTSLYKRLSINKYSLYSLFPSIHATFRCNLLNYDRLENMVFELYYI